MYLRTVELHSQTASIEFHDDKVVKHVDILSKENTSSLLISFYWVKTETCFTDGCKLLSWEMNDSTSLPLSSKSIHSIPSINRLYFPSYFLARFDYVISFLRTTLKKNYFKIGSLYLFVQ